MERKKTRRSGILPLLALAVVILWLPMVYNAGLNFNMDAEGISPENSFFIQGMLGMAWFMYPASMVVVTVLLIQTERSGQGLHKMLALPVSPAALCLAKFCLLPGFAAAQLLLCAAVYGLSAAAASRLFAYSFLLPPLFVLQEIGLLWLSSLPMLALFWLLAVWFQTPVYAVGLGFASIVPSVLLINTRVWFAWPPCYPFFVLRWEYGKLAEHLNMARPELLPWLPAAAAAGLLCLLVACLRFGRAERR